MIKAMLKPFFRKFFGLFISMVFVSMLSVGLLTCFGSCILNVRNNYQEFVTTCQDMDEQITTSFTNRENLVNAVKSVEGVEVVEARLTIDCYLYKDNRTIVSRVFAYDEKETKIFNYEPCVIKRVDRVNDLPNIGVTEKFARNNGFELGQRIKLGFFDRYEEFYISEIVNTPEGIYPRANNYIWSDNYDFGYLYCSETELTKGLNNVVEKVLQAMVDNLEYKEMVEKAMAVAGITIPQLDLIDEDFVRNYANQLMIKNVKGAEDDIVLEKCTKAIEATTDTITGNKVEVRSSVVRAYMPHIAYMDHALDQVQIASIFLPVFFYSVTMIVVGLFINQIIKTMTPQIGVFMSIGIDNRDTVKLFLIFTIIMGLTSGLLGVPVGYALNILMAKVMKQTYCIPSISPALNPWVVVSAIIGLLIFVVITTLLATRSIFRITPKDATISNESKRKPLPKAIQKFIDKAPMNIKLGTNSICQNPRRFFVSTFSIFASLVLILLSTLFFVSKEEMIDQSVNRRLNYSAQVYLTTKDEELGSVLETFTDDAGTPVVSAYESCYYTYLKVDTNSDDKVYLECLAVKEGLSNLITVPDQKGKGNLPIPETGVILPKSSAEKLKVKKGDSISINGISVKVQEISYQYFHPITYLSKSQLQAITDTFVSSYMINTTDDALFLKKLSANQNQCLTVFTESLSKDLKNIFDSINVMIFIMVGFSLGMAFIILAIMSQNALMEQQRPLTVFRAIGFTIFDISNVWTLQSIAQLFVSSLFGVPAGALSIYILLRLASSSSQTYPFVMNWLVVLMAIGFVLLVVITCHLLSMISIRRWNIADNTRSRE